MEGKWSDHFPVVDQPRRPIIYSSSIPTKMEGKWSDHFPVVDQPPPPPPPPRYQRRLLCPLCNSSICRLFTATTTNNNGRKFYTCPAKDHKFFKWEEDVKDDELIDVPECGGCSAGTCRVRREMTGPNAGRILFMCRVKEGEGSCGYRVWKDELEMSAETVEKNESITSFLRILIDCETTNLTNTKLVDKTNENDNEPNESPVIDISSKSQEHKSGESSNGPSKRSRYEDLEGISSPPDSSFSLQDKIPGNSGVSITRTVLGVESCRKSLFNPVCNGDLSGFKHLPVSPDVQVQSHNDRSRETRFPNFTTKLSISKAFAELADLLQTELFALLETMEFSDHEAMNQAAEDTFAALDRLLIDHRDLRDRAENLVHCAKSLAEIEESIMPINDCSYRKLADLCWNERTKLDKVNSTHAKMVDLLTNNKTRVKFMQDEISSAKDWLFQVESELSCAEVELRSMEHELDRISKFKDVLERKYLIVSKELEETREMHRQRDAAKAAFDRAKSLLRG